MGPIRVLYGQKSLYRAKVGPKWDKCPESAQMVPIYTCLLVKVYQYGTYMGKKAYMGPMQDPNGINVQILPIWVPYIHVCWEVTDQGDILFKENSIVFEGSPKSSVMKEVISLGKTVLS